MTEKLSEKYMRFFIPEIPTRTLLSRQPLFPSAADKVAIDLLLVLYKMLCVFLLVWVFLFCCSFFFFFLSWWTSCCKPIAWDLSLQAQSHPKASVEPGENKPGHALQFWSCRSSSRELWTPLRYGYQITISGCKHHAWKTHIQILKTCTKSRIFLFSKLLNF